VGHDDGAPVIELLRGLGEALQRGDDDEERGEQEGSACEAEARAVGDEVAEGRAERAVGENGESVEGLGRAAELAEDASGSRPRSRSEGAKTAASTAASSSVSRAQPRRSVRERWSDIVVPAVHASVMTNQ
jgi:hypothetical protein